jgi:hypothetical protein
MRAPASSDKLIGSRTLRERYDNISDMTVWRWLRDPYLGYQRYDGLALAARPVFGIPATDLPR